jgi:esterase/lipase
MQRFIRIYFFVVSRLFPKVASRQAFELFQFTFPVSKRFRKSELELYRTTNSFYIEQNNVLIRCFELGDDSNPLLFVLHGWNSNPGSMYKIAKSMVEKGYYVILVELPAHGYSKLKQTNMVHCSSAFKAVLQRLALGKPFSLITHSFGSAVASYALCGTHYQVDRWVMLTSPNRLVAIMREFQDAISLSEASYDHMTTMGVRLVLKPIDSVTVEDQLKSTRVNKLLLIHDPYDKVLPFSNAKSIVEKNENAKLVAMEKIGHYRMLTNSNVLYELDQFIEHSQKVGLREQDQVAVLN